MEYLEQYLDDLPLLNIGKKVGITEYIDFLVWDEVTSPIMQGYDIFGRRFIVIKMVINNIKIMQTFFQRYSNGKLWMGCGHATINLIETSGGMDKSQFLLLSKIISEGKAIIEECHIPISELFVNNTVELFNQDKWNSTLIIQKYWRNYKNKI